jgi:hypothetical protein
LAGGIGIKVFLPCAGGALEHRPIIRRGFGQFVVKTSNIFSSFS